MDAALVLLLGLQALAGYGEHLGSDVRHWDQDVDSGPREMANSSNTILSSFFFFQQLS